ADPLRPERLPEHPAERRQHHGPRDRHADHRCVLRGDRLQLAGNRDPVGECGQRQGLSGDPGRHRAGRSVLSRRQPRHRRRGRRSHSTYERCLMATLLDEAVARRRFSSGYGRHRAQLISGLVVITVVAVCSLLAPLLAPYDPILTDPTAKFLPPASPGHLLGTDELGRDLLSRLLWGGRTSLLLAVAAVAAATVLGSSAALAAGFAGPRLSGLIMRVVDVLFAFPVILVAIALAALLSPGAGVVVFAIGFAVIPYITRVVFAEVKQQRG